jgi:hypothetical protein
MVVEVQAMVSRGRVFQRGQQWWIAYCGPDPVTGQSKEFREWGGATRPEARRALAARLGPIHLAKKLTPTILPSGERNVAVVHHPSGRVEWRLQMMRNGRTVDERFSSLAKAIERRERYRRYGLPPKGETPNPDGPVDMPPTPVDDPALARLGPPALRIPLRTIESPVVYAWLGPDKTVRYVGLGRRGLERPLARKHHIPPRLSPQDELVVWTFNSVEEAAQAEDNILAARSTEMNVTRASASITGVNQDA